jgi:phage tail-like protein
MSYILKLVPPWLRVGLARELVSAIAQPLDDWRARIGAAFGYMDPHTAPVSWLPWLAEVVGLPPLDNLSLAAQRALIASAVRGWASKGTRPEIERWVKALAGITAELRPLQSSAFIAGITTAGEVCGPGDETAWRYEVAIAAGSIAPAELRQLLALVAPAWAQFRIVDLDDNILSDFE